MPFQVCLVLDLSYWWMREWHCCAPCNIAMCVLSDVSPRYSACLDIANALNHAFALWFYISYFFAAIVSDERRKRNDGTGTRESLGSGGSVRSRRTRKRIDGLPMQIDGLSIDFGPLSGNKTSRSICHQGLRLTTADITLQREWRETCMPTHISKHDTS